MPRTSAFAPAKINLTLHVTGLRADGYHLLDSLVAFADTGDRLTVAPAAEMRLTVSGPRAAGVPTDARNLCWQAAEWFGETAEITLEKHLPAAAGIGGGSSDAAAVLRALSALTGRALPGQGLEALGADLPVCLHARAARMSGIGERLQAVALPDLNAVLANPGVGVPTPAVFKALGCKDNPPMPALPEAAEWHAWLAAQRNDLQAPAITVQPVIAEVLAALQATTGARLARMSGSGATCFALYDSRAEAEAAAEALRAAQPGWWVAPCTLR
jgi:4-diphosphocytidyl-2-C-methyl-D-erythritol kinase